MTTDVQLDAWTRSLLFLAINALLARDTASFRAIVFKVVIQAQRGPSGIADVALAVMRQGVNPIAIASLLLR